MREQIVILISAFDVTITHVHDYEKVATFRYPFGMMDNKRKDALSFAQMYHDMLKPDFEFEAVSTSEQFLPAWLLSYTRETEQPIAEEVRIGWHTEFMVRFKK